MQACESSGRVCIENIENYRLLSRSQEFPPNFSLACERVLNCILTGRSDIRLHKRERIFCLL